MMQSWEVRQQQMRGSSEDGRTSAGRGGTSAYAKMSAPLPIYWLQVVEPVSDEWWEKQYCVQAKGEPEWDALNG